MSLNRNCEPLYLPPPEPAITYSHDNFRDGVLVPGVQALITGLFAGMATGGVIALLKIDLSPWLTGFVAGSVAGLVGWMAYRNTWQWSIVSTLEHLFQVDFNRDGLIGVQQDPPEPQYIKVEIEHDKNHHEYIDLPYPERLPKLAAGLSQGRVFSLSAWTGQGALFSRSEFETLRAELLRRGLAVWKNPQATAQGLTLTVAGKAVFKKFENIPPTLPSGDK